mmetsp:Transcript_2885/g.2961  ORF Transcript_2885/g.2961 Transcript_2885/m.2961 type:complete len:443 (+) Transcript_2885:2-1330(+)
MNITKSSKSHRKSAHFSGKGNEKDEDKQIFEIAKESLIISKLEIKYEKMKRKKLEKISNDLELDLNFKLGDEVEESFHHIPNESFKVSGSNLMMNYDPYNGNELMTNSKVHQSKMHKDINGYPRHSKSNGNVNSEEHCLEDEVNEPSKSVVRNSILKNSKSKEQVATLSNSDLNKNKRISFLNNEKYLAYSSKTINPKANEVLKTEKVELYDSKTEGRKKNPSHSKQNQQTLEKTIEKNGNNEKELEENHHLQESIQHTNYTQYSNIERDIISKTSLSHKLNETTKKPKSTGPQRKNTIEEERPPLKVKFRSSKDESRLLTINYKPKIIINSDSRTDSINSGNCKEMKENSKDNNINKTEQSRSTTEISSYKKPSIKKYNPGKDSTNPNDNDKSASHKKHIINDLGGKGESSSIINYQLSSRENHAKKKQQRSSSCFSFLCN